MFNKHNFLLLHCTYGFVFFNLLAAYVPSASIIFVFLRDSWVFWLIYILLSTNHKISLHLLSFIAVFAFVGLLPVVERLTILDATIYFYGFRDLCLIAMVVYFLVIRPKMNAGILYSFVWLNILAVAFEIYCSLVGIDTFREIMRIDEYFNNKGVVTNLDRGLFGQRITGLLYAPALIAGLFTTLLWTDFRRLGKVSASLLGLATLSKAAPLIIGFYYFRRFWVVILIGVFATQPLILGVTTVIKNQYPNTIYSFHAHSVSERVFLNAFDEGDAELFPDALGSSSVFAAVAKGEDSSVAPESLLVSRIKDFNLLAIPFVLFLFFLAKQCRGHRDRFALFVSVCLLTGLSNHPVCWLPLLLHLGGQQRTAKHRPRTG